jgi:hypothetical protein
VSRQSRCYIQPLLKVCNTSNSRPRHSSGAMRARSSAWLHKPLEAPPHTRPPRRTDPAAGMSFVPYAATRWFITLAGGPVFWKTKKQTVMTSSSTEAEFINLTPAGISLKWFNGMLAEFGAAQKEPLLPSTLSTVPGPDLSTSGINGSLIRFSARRSTYVTLREQKWRRMA